MITAIALIIRISLDVALACHCSSWVDTEHGWRCVAPLERPRCEIVTGWHPISFGVVTCSRACKEYSDG